MLGQIETQTMAPSYPFVGRHFVASYVGCELDVLQDAAAVLSMMSAAATAAGATVLKTVEHRFPTGGMTAVLLLAESHASIHTYPEHASCFVDLFTCGAECDADRFDAELRRWLRPLQVDARLLVRGA